LFFPLLFWCDSSPLLFLLLVLGEGGVEAVQVVGEESHLALEEEEGCLLLLLLALLDMLVGKRGRKGGREGG